MPDSPTAGTPRRIGPYEVLEEIGRGGMGAVYRARDTRLGRIVALKVLLGGSWASPEAVDRFQREAALVARMGKHPHVVQVHDFGREGDFHYFTMDYIEGRSLRGWISERRPLRDVLALGRKVALGLAHAHANGIVHRDLKPENVLVDASGEPQVTDFGLARDVGATVQFSVSGTILGTPAYMAPEQAAGHSSRIGPWTDVHALGVLLYEGITGRTPFGTFDIASTIRRVISDDPPPLRVEVPRDVETILARCLEKDPERRYPGCAEVAEEIGRYLGGEAIQARPATLADRVLRRIRRNPLVSALATVALVAAILTIGVSWKARREVEEADARTREASKRAADEALKYLAEGGADLLDAALAFRAAGDLKGCLERVSRLRTKVDELKSIAPDLAEPWFYEGRIERALGRSGAALDSFERAIRLASRTDASEGSRAVLAPSRYQRGVLRAQAYQVRLEARRLDMLRSAAQSRRDDVFAPPLPEVPDVLASSPELVLLRDAAIRDLRDAEKGLPATEGGAGSAIAAILDRREEEGRAELEAAITAQPRLEEAYVILAGDAASRGEWEAATGWFARAHEADRGCLAHLLGRARIEIDWAYEPDLPKDGWRARLDRAAAAIDEAVRLSADSVEAWTLRTAVESIRVEFLRSNGLDRSSETAAARAAAERVIELDPESTLATTVLACLEHDAGHELAHQGRDPSAELARARTLYQRARDLAPEDPLALCNLASVDRTLIEWLEATGADPREAYERAFGQYEEAMRVSPRYHEAACGLGTAHAEYGGWIEASGRDPLDRYERALAALRRALDLKPDFAPTLASIVDILSRLARRSVRGGVPAREAYAPALDSWRRASGVCPRSREIALLGPRIWSELAETLLDAGEEADAELASAGACVSEAMADGLSSPELLSRHGWVCSLEARRLRVDGRDPYEKAAMARAAMERAVEASPRLAMLWSDLGVVRMIEASWRIEDGEDASGLLSEAASAFEKSMEANAGYASAMVYLGEVRALEADAAAASGRDAMPLRDEAIEWVDRALGIAPGDFEAHEARAGMLGTLGEGRWMRGEDAGEVLEKARAAWDRLIAAAPRRGDLVGARAGVHLALARNARDHGRGCEDEYRKAIEDGLRAAGLSPGLAKGPAMAGWAHLELAYQAGGDGEAATEYTAAIECFEGALKLAPRSVDSLCGAAAALSGLAQCGTQDGKDALERVRRAIGLYDRALEVRPGEANILSDRGLARRALGTLALGLGEDPTPMYEAALADWAEALEIAPGYSHAGGNHAGLLMEMGRVEEAVAACERQAEAHPQEGWALQMLEAARSDARRLVEGPEWSRRAAEGEVAARRGDLVAVRAAYEAAIAALESEISSLPETDRAARRSGEAVTRFASEARLRLACVAAQGSLGRDRPWGTGRSIEPSESARLRDEAFAHLDAAIEAGLLDAASVRDDRDLRPLHGDPRWQAFLSRLPRPK